jgi:hypothetical protein
MKKVLLIILVTLGLFYVNSCTKPENKICACGVKNPAKNLPWLAELIEKAENDKTMLYHGVIWLENYEGQDVFVTNMPLSGSFLYLVFDCEGNNLYLTIDDKDAYYYFLNHLKKEIVIYVSQGYPLK